MPKALSGFYNFRTKLSHKLFRRPIYLKAAFDNRIKAPKLTVIFLHGISATSDTWRTTLREFNKNPDLKNVRLIALDLLGFGKSLQANWLDYDYLDYNSALHHSLKYYKITGPFVIVGHSMGSLIAANFAADRHTSENLVGLILVSPPILMPEELAKLPDKVYTKSYSALHRLAKDEPALSVVANLVQRFSSFRSQYIKTPAFGRSMDQIILNHLNYQTFDKIKVPTLIIHGHFDPLVMKSNLKQAADRNPRIRFCSVIGHHDISTQKRTKILIELKRILREQQHANQTHTV